MRELARHKFFYSLVRPTTHYTIYTKGINTMGMVACFASASPEELTRLLNDPTGLEEYLHSETDDPPDYIDLDKSWHAIHYMLCGDAMEGSGPGAQAVLADKKSVRIGATVPRAL